MRPVYGRDSVARFMVGTKRFWPEDAQVGAEEVNGETAMIIQVGDRAIVALTIEAEQGRIQAIRILANPEKLTRI